MSFHYNPRFVPFQQHSDSAPDRCRHGQNVAGYPVPIVPKKKFTTPGFFTNYDHVTPNCILLLLLKMVKLKLLNYCLAFTTDFSGHGLQIHSLKSIDIPVEVADGLEI